MRITSEIFQVAGPGITGSGDAAAYLVRFGGEAALVDAGCGPSVEAMLGRVRDAGVGEEEVKLLLLTHCHFDHTGGAAALRGRLGCRTVAHELEAPFIEEGDDVVSAAKWYGASLTPCPVDVKLRGLGEAIPLGGRTVEAVHAPGHSPGSVVYLVESDGLRVLFGQDVHGPLDASLRSDARDYRSSLQKLLDLEADLLCEGHYGVYRGRDEVADFIRGFL